MSIKYLLIAFLSVLFIETVTSYPPPQPVQAGYIEQDIDKPNTTKASEASQKKKVGKKTNAKKKTPQQAPKQAQVVSQPAAPARPAPVPSSGNIVSIITAAANRHGVDVDRALRIARCESGLDSSAVNYGYNENGYPSGLYQHLSGYWPARAAQHGYPGASVFDPVANANVTMAMWASGSAGLWECQ